MVDRLTKISETAAPTVDPACQTMDAQELPSRGRRPGNPDTRAEIVQAAHRLFTATGYDGTSMRAIAREAGVDPALLRHYFADKSALFLQAARLSVDPRKLVRRIASGGREQLGERTLRLALPIWDSPFGTSVADAVRQNPEIFPVYARVMAHTIEEAAERALPELTVAERQMRVGMMLTVIGGLFITRYVSRLEPVASMPAKVVVQRWGPLLQLIVDGH